MKTLREYIEEIDSTEVEEGTMAAAAKHPSGAKFGGYYGATQKGPPRPGQGAGGCEESVDPDRDHEEDPLEEDSEDSVERVLTLSNELQDR